jgi:glycosyltransferase involved in cell wall biosynthesis
LNDPAGTEIDVIRVLQVTAPGPYGGRETVVRDLAIGLHDRGHAVEVLAVLDEGTDPAAHPFVAALETRGVPVRPVVLGSRAYRAEARAIRQMVDAMDARIVHSHGYRTDVVAALALRSSDAATISTAHGFTGGGWKNRLYERLQAVAWGRCDAVVAVSAPMVGALESRGVDPSRIQLIPNAWRDAGSPLSRLEARRGLGIGDDARVVGWVGRLSSEKGPDVALDAFGRLTDARAELHFVGDGRMRGDLEARARELGIDERVRWHGPVVDAGRYLAAFDLLVLSSRTEGTPMVLFEAMAADVPIVATTVGGVPDVVSEREALLVPSEDPGALATAIGRVLGFPDEAGERAVRAAHRLRSAYAVEPWLDAHVSLYRGLLGFPTEREESSA